MDLQPIKICYFPGRESGFVRNRVLIKGLREAGAVVYDCSLPQKKVSRYFGAFLKFLRYQGKSDIILIGFLGQFLVPIVKLCTRKKIMFDAFLSVYQTLAFDRGAIKPNGPPARLVRFVERLSCRLSDIVFLDTDQHIEYFLREYGLDKRKFYRSFLGADDSFQKREGVENFKESGEGRFLVHFHGEFQALHGTQVILQEASLLPDVQFRMIGAGRELTSCLDMAEKLKLKNVAFFPPVRWDLIPGYIAEADVCLGIFGSTQKTQLVIPFKVYEAMAMGKPVLTADTPAVRELLTHEENVYLCEAGNSESLAQAIKRLKTDSALRNRIAENGFKIYKEKCSPSPIGSQIIEHARELIEHVR